MSTSVSSVVKHFPSAENGFTTTLSGSISSGAVTVGLNSVAGYTNGEVAVFVVDPTDAAKKQTFTGTIDTGGVQVTDVVWTAGTNQAHAAGATVVDYATATHISMMTKGLLVEHAQTGLHTLTSSATITSSKVITGLNDTNGNEIFKVGATGSAVNELTLTNAATGNAPIISSTGGDTNIGLTLTPKGTGNISMTSRADGWVTGLTAPSTVTALGNRFYNLTVSGTDYTDRLSPGMKLRLTRTVTAPTQCTDLEASSSQYYSKSSPNKCTFTDDFVVSAWIKLESYPATQSIMSRYNGTSGWSLEITTTGQVYLLGYNGGVGNVSYVSSYGSVPLNRWVHVAAQLDMSAFTATTTTSYIMFDGLDVSASVARTGTNPTALIQAGNLEVGGRNGGLQPFDGKIAQAAYYTAKVTQATILASFHQGLAGTETSLGSAYSFSNSITDLNTTTPNDLTAQNSAVATATDTPYAGGATGTTEYAEITSISFSTDTTIGVRTTEYGAIPTSGGVSALAYSTMERPFGCPVFSKVLGMALLNNVASTTTTGSMQDINLSVTVIIPEKNSGVRITFFSPRFTMSAAGACVFAIREGSTTLANTVKNKVASDDGPMAEAKYIGTPSAGSHTYKASIGMNSASTLSVYGGVPTTYLDSSSTFIMVELV